ncbi:MAG TPA: hypothetical protein VHO70_09455 [Chitinispirillaceae bacterium]|nr:hypothetical protein [Chitinispirillaceae bacterium]
MNRAFRYACTLTVFISVFWSFAAGESTISWRVFKKEDNTWICNPKGIMLFSSLSRSIKPFNIDPVRKIDTLTDCIEYDGYLWVSSNAGLYQIEMATQSIERISFPSDSAIMGKIAVDFDYLWLGTDEMLFRFDKLGREWMEFELPEKNGLTVGLWSNGSEICMLGHKTLFRFATSTEKWKGYSLDKPLSDKAVFYPGLNTFKVLDGTTVSLYQPELYTWVHTALGLIPTDVLDEDSVVYCSDGRTVRKIACASGLARSLNLPNPGKINAIAKVGDSLIVSADKRIGKFSLSKETMDYLEYDPNMQTDKISRIIPLSAFYLFVSPTAISTYEKGTKAWQHISRTGLHTKSKIFSWNQEECALRYAPGYQTKISGSIETGITFDLAGYDTTYRFTNSRWEWQKKENGDSSLVHLSDSTISKTEPVFKFGKPNFKGDISIHTTDKNDRMADIFLNNTSRLSAPEKGIYYRGNRNDYLNSVRIGTMDNSQIESPLMPSISMEGGSAVFESKTRLASRDRKKLRIIGGAGFITTRTVKKIIPYRTDGIYEFSLSDSTDTLGEGDTLKYVKQSCRVFIDGELLDTTQFTFNTTRGQLSFNTLAPIDPASSIIVEYKVQTVPDGDISNIELVPEHNFGKLYYGALTYSPTDWISAQVGYTGIDRDSINNNVNVSVPLEFRSKEKKFMLQFKPEMLYNVNNEAKAGSAQLQSRIGEKTGIIANAMFVDSNFVSNDTLTQGYGAQKGEYDFTISHDIRQELPLSYYQHQKFGTHGIEDRFALTAGMRFKGLPFLEISAARTVIEKDKRLEDTTIAIDSLYHIKDKVKFRLYETSSDFLQKLTHFYKISYDLTHCESMTEENGSDERDHGRLTTGSFLLSPIQRIMLSGELFYRGSMNIEGMPTSDIKPSLNFQMTDAPPGVDVLGYYNLKFSRFAPTQTATDSIDRSIGLVLNPGKWVSALGWFSPRVKITQTVNCGFNTIDVPVDLILSGLHGKENSRISRELGLNVYPFNGLLITNTSQWADSDGKKTFSTVNRINYIYDASNILTLDCNYSSTGEKYDGMLLYEKLWQPWLRTSTALKANRDHVDGHNIKFGPKILAILNFLDAGFLYSLSNTHDFDVQWKRRNGVTIQTPEISYSLGLRVKFKPNLELQVSNTKFTFGGGKFADFTNSTILLACF